MMHLLLTLRFLSPKGYTEVHLHITALNATVQCTPTFHHLGSAYYHILSTIKFQTVTTEKLSEKGPIIVCPTRESNARRLVRQSHLRQTRQSPIHIRK
ncbi:hypothetical protein SFRURICE_007671 [Spodoptera frugiperda]|nr:hypothetical protein SFRURICE_007671 [Spodoptera frugiperda]